MEMVTNGCQREVMNTEKIDLAVLLDTFQKKYEYLYNYPGRPAGYAEAVEEGERFIRENPEFISDFTLYREDAITSDREVAALIFALRETKKTQDCQEYYGRWRNKGVVFEIFRKWGGKTKDHLECYTYPEGMRGKRMLFAHTSRFIDHMDFLLFCQYNFCYAAK